MEMTGLSNIENQYGLCLRHRETFSVDVCTSFEGGFDSTGLGASIAFRAEDFFSSCFFEGLTGTHSLSVI